MLDSQSYLSTQEAAVAMNLTDGRVRQMLRAGEILGKRLGRHAWAIPSGEVSRIIEQRQKTNPTTTDSR